MSDERDKQPPEDDQPVKLSDEQLRAQLEQDARAARDPERRHPPDPNDPNNRHPEHAHPNDPQNDPTPRPSDQFIKAAAERAQEPKDTAHPKAKPVTP